MHSNNLWTCKISVHNDYEVAEVMQLKAHRKSTENKS